MDRVRCKRAYSRTSDSDRTTSSMTNGLGNGLSLAPRNPKAKSTSLIEHRLMGVSNKEASSVVLDTQPLSCPPPVFPQCSGHCMGTR